jgi:hypothetical protein
MGQVDRIDLLRTQVAKRVLRPVNGGWRKQLTQPDQYPELETGMCMVNHGLDFVTPSTGDAHEVFAGFAMEVELNPGRALVGWGHFRVFTMWYDADADWNTSAGCVPVAGPNGLLTTGKYPEDLPRAVGRVVSVPRVDDPFLGISGFSHA